MSDEHSTQDRPHKLPRTAHMQLPRTPKPEKPAKPRPDFPLFPHASGQWAKKIRGRLHYFGVWADPDAAEASYNEQAEALHNGRTPEPDPEDLTIKGLCNSFLNDRKAKLDVGELSPKTFADYKADCDLLVKYFTKARRVDDLRPADFAALRDAMARRWGPAHLGASVARIRCVFKYAFANELIDRPARFGTAFAPPSRKVMRKHRAEQGPKLFTAEEVRRLLAAAPQPLKAAILLGIGNGLGNHDVSGLRAEHLDLDAGILDYPRLKTGIPRRSTLWPETVQALREAAAARPKPKDKAHAGLYFLSKTGLPLTSPASNSDHVGFEFRRLLKALGINGRKGLGFYTLRHVYRTVADEAKDQPATDLTMGHEVPGMSGVYRETISDDRLRAVSEHVRTWLFGDSTPTP
jgi:integrase